VHPTQYRLVVAGELSSRYALAFEGMEIHAEAGRTTISGVVTDQAHLHCLIDRVGDLGLELLDLTIVGAPPERAAERTAERPAGAPR
jgi:hypothetical protein